jgi:hypothetical protein
VLFLVRNWAVSESASERESVLFVVTVCVGQGKIVSVSVCGRF